MYLDNTPYSFPAEVCETSLQYKPPQVKALITQRSRLQLTGFRLIAPLCTITSPYFLDHFIQLDE